MKDFSLVQNSGDVKFFAGTRAIESPDANWEVFCSTHSCSLYLRSCVQNRKSRRSMQETQHLSWLLQ